MVEGHTFYVKRDDLIDPRFSGNKARKFHSLFSIPSDRYDTLVSYGGAQSNAMLSLAHLARMKGWRFEYHCKRLPAWLKEAPTGNLAAALHLGMELQETDAAAFYEKVHARREQCGERELFIHQGGADPVAEAGVKVLAREVEAWFTAQGLDRGSVVLPSGTGSTALYLRKHLPLNITVATVPVVGDTTTLTNQWRSLDATATFPKILSSFKWPFAKPHTRFLRIWRHLLEAGIEFDMIYAPKTWLALLQEADRLPGPILYIHTGGVSGNESQMEQYRYRKLV